MTPLLVYLVGAAITYVFVCVKQKELIPIRPAGWFILGLLWPIILIVEIVGAIDDARNLVERRP